MFQIIDKTEKEFNFGRDAIFVDMETGEEITTQSSQIQKSYQTAFSEYSNLLKTECAKYGIDYNLIDTNEPYDKALLNLFNKRKRLH